MVYEAGPGATATSEPTLAAFFPPLVGGKIGGVDPNAGGGGSGGTDPNAGGTESSCPCRVVTQIITKYLVDEPVDANSIPVEVEENRVICDEVPTVTRVRCGQEASLPAGTGAGPGGGGVTAVQGLRGLGSVGLDLDFDIDDILNQIPGTIPPGEQPVVTAPVPEPQPQAGSGIMPFLGLGLLFGTLVIIGNN